MRQRLLLLFGSGTPRQASTSSLSGQGSLLIQPITRLAPFKIIKPKMISVPSDSRHPTSSSNVLGSTFYSSWVDASRLWGLSAGDLQHQHVTRQRLAIQANQDQTPAPAPAPAP